ncbi:hypothetical protein PVK06_012517 [Gossypium arboreum]|uniref:30S ribosomal protein S16, chloroplastic n=1 Tax=Gossypium arboreum TaxID=29729 RepID=A0ABR0QCD3_GOSAR|nr:hypothetical protein PVK06_012517 [Gossypium arboreum]
MTLLRLSRRGRNTNITFPHGTYLSYLFRRLGISTHGDTPVTINQSIIYGALHYVGYHYGATNSMWIKSDHLEENEDDDIHVAFEDISIHEQVPSPKHVPPTALSSHTALASSEINGAILDVIHSLGSDVRGLQYKVRSHRDKVNSRLSMLETQMASLLAHFPLTPLFSPHNDD